MLQAVKIHSYRDFERLLREWESSEWLRNYSWIKDEVLPKNKKFNEPAPDEYISDMMVSPIVSDIKMHHAIYSIIFLLASLSLNFTGLGTIYFYI